MTPRRPRAAVVAVVSLAACLLGTACSSAAGTTTVAPAAQTSAAAAAPANITGGSGGNCTAAVQKWIKDGGYELIDTELGADFAAIAAHIDPDSGDGQSDAQSLATMQADLDQAHQPANVPPTCAKAVYASFMAARSAFAKTAALVTARGASDFDQESQVNQRGVAATSALETAVQAYWPS